MVPAPPPRPLSVPMPPDNSSVLLLPLAVLPTTSPISTPVAPTTSRFAPAPANFTAWLVPEIVPLLVTVPAPPYTAAPSGPEIDPPAALVICRPALSRTPNEMVPPMLPLLSTVPIPASKFTPRWLTMVAPALLATVPPAAISTA